MLLSDSLFQGSHEINCSIGGSRSIKMIIDSGSAVNAIPEKDEKWVNRQVKEGKMKIVRECLDPDIALTGYAAKSPMTVVKSFWAKITTTDFEKPTVFAEFFVIRGARKALLSRSTALKMKVLAMGREVNEVTIADEFPAMPGVEVDFEVDPEVKPVSNGYVNIPLHYRGDAKRKIREMVRQGVAYRVRGHAEWLSGVSAVPKGKNGCRLVVNMRAPNKAIKRVNHPMPRPEEMRTKLAGAKYFSKLDLTSAYHHLKLSKKSQELTTFLMPDGMYRFKRLCFGVNCAPEIFQSHMERIFKGVKNTVIYLDDVLVFGKSLEELRATTEEVQRILKENNLSINEEKCEYDKESLTFLGFKLSAEGLAIDPEKAEAIAKAREPRTQGELKSFLGLANFMREHIPNFADLTKPLREADKEGTFTWGEGQASAFAATKTAIRDCTVTLGYFNTKDKTIVYTDASEFGIGAVLTQVDANGKERVISFASKALTKPERNYPQIQREGLGIVWGVEHFYYYLMGSEFIIRTDAEGAKFIFDRSQDAKKPKRFLRRSEGWAMRLEYFNYTIEHIKGENNIADVLSRLVNTDEEPEPYVEGLWPGEVMQVEEDQEQSLEMGEDILTMKEIEEGSVRCKEIQEVLMALQSGVWPQKLRTYELVQDELEQKGNILTKAGRMVLPVGLREKAVGVAHIGHLGITKTTGMLRERLWWPRLQALVTKRLKKCFTCRINGKPLNPVPMERSELPPTPWSCLASDFAGPFHNHRGMYVYALVDCYSRYVITALVKSTSLEDIRPVLMEVFNIFGLPEQVKSDNGPPFFGKEYKLFLESLGIEVRKSWPRQPNQNGQAENIMKHAKKAAEAAAAESTNLAVTLARRVRAHNTAPHRVTGVSPAELLFKRKLRFGIPSLSSPTDVVQDEEVRKRDKESKMRGKELEDRKRKAQEAPIVVGDTVVQVRETRMKGDTVFDPRELTVTNIRAGDVTMRDQEGTIVRRGIGKLQLMVKGDGSWGVDKPIKHGQTAKKRKLTPNTGSVEEAEAVPATERPRRQVKQPENLKDYVMYKVDKE